MSPPGSRRSPSTACRWSGTTGARRWAFPGGSGRGDVVAIADGYARWLATSQLPKLFINADPGTILTGAQREFCRRWPNQEEITVRGIHFIQEDSPREIGEAVARFVERLPS